MNWLWREMWGLLAVVLAVVDRPLFMAVALTFAVLSSLDDLTRALTRSAEPRPLRSK